MLCQLLGLQLNPEFRSGAPFSSGLQGLVAASSSPNSSHLAVLITWAHGLLMTSSAHHCQLDCSDPAVVLQQGFWSEIKPAVLI